MYIFKIYKTIPNGYEHTHKHTQNRNIKIIKIWAKNIYIKLRGIVTSWRKK